MCYSFALLSSALSPGPIDHDIIHSAAITAAEHESDLKLITDTPYLALPGELWGVSCEDIAENYNGTALYLLTWHTWDFYKWIDCTDANN